METKLWALLIPGPDDLWAMPSKAVADDAAEVHNKAIENYGMAERFGMPGEALCAQVIEWPHSAAEHAEALASGESDVFVDSYNSAGRVCAHGIHMDNACGACVPPRGTR